MTEHQLFCLFEPLNGSEGFCALKNAVSGACVAYAYGVEEAQRTHVLAALMEGTGRTLAGGRAQRISWGSGFVEDMNALLPGAAALLPAREVSFVRSAASSRDLTIPAAGNDWPPGNGPASRARAASGRVDAPADAARAIRKAHHSVFRLVQTGSIRAISLPGWRRRAMRTSIWWRRMGNLPCAAALWTSSLWARQRLCAWNSSTTRSILCASLMCSLSAPWGKREEVTFFPPRAKPCSQRKRRARRRIGWQSCWFPKRARRPWSGPPAGN